MRLSLSLCLASDTQGPRVLISVLLARQKGLSLSLGFVCETLMSFSLSLVHKNWSQHSVLESRFMACNIISMRSPNTKVEILHETNCKYHILIQKL